MGAAGPPLELLESLHEFPGSYQIRAIGLSEDDFVGRVLAAAVEELSGPSEIESSSRFTPGGRHVSVTMTICVQSADQVRAIYSRVGLVSGLTLLL